MYESYQLNAYNYNEVTWEYAPKRQGSGHNLFYRVGEAENKKLGYALEIGRFNGNDMAFDAIEIGYFDPESDPELIKKRSIQSVNYFYVSPLLFLQNAITPSTSIYMGLGPRLAIPKLTTHQTYNWKSGDIRENTWESNKKLTLGGQATIGLMTGKNRTRFFVELTYSALTYSFDEEKMTKAEWNNESILSDLTADSKTYKLKDSVTHPNPDNSGTKYSYALNNLALQFGLCIDLSKKSKSTISFTPTTL